MAVNYSAFGDDFLRSLAAGATAELARRKAQPLLRSCAWCRKVQDDREAWRDLEGFVHALTGMEFTHGICPDCLGRHHFGAPDSE